jgi:hypothetical protein
MKGERPAALAQIGKTAQFLTNAILRLRRRHGTHA